jgi:hypothetical protein
MTRTLYRTMTVALLALALAPAATARAAGSDPSSVATTPLAAPAARPLPLVGVMLDAGVPDGATASLVLRPMSWLRAEAGGGYNLVSKSVRGGLSLIPFGSGPSATIEAGHYFEGDANGLARKLAGAGFEDNALLQRVGYDFVNAHLGIEMGARRVTFFIHGGMSYVRAKVHNINAAIEQEMPSGGGTTVSFNQDPIVRAFIPSVKLGLIVYLF